MEATPPELRFQKLIEGHYYKHLKSNKVTPPDHLWELADGFRIQFRNGVLVLLMQLIYHSNGRCHILDVIFVNQVELTFGKKIGHSYPDSPLRGNVLRCPVFFLRRGNLSFNEALLRQICRCKNRRAMHGDAMTRLMELSVLLSEHQS